MEGERGADVYQTFDDMKIERLVALALREMNGKNKAELKSVFKSLNIETNDKFIHEIVKYIKDKGLGHALQMPHGRFMVRPSHLIAQDYIQKQTMLSFEDNVKLIASELGGIPGRKAILEDLLTQLHIDHVDDDIRDYVTYFKETGIIEITASWKGAHEIFLTYKGIDYLNGKYPNSSPTGNVTNVHFNGNPQVGAVGTNATAHNNTFNQVNQLPADFNYDALVEELARVRIALASSTERAHHAIMGEVTQAEIAAEVKDGNKVLEHLKRGGKMLWSFSENVGANIIANLMAGQVVG